MDITPVDAWPSAFPVIDDGDICSNAEHLATAQAHADAALYLKNKLAVVQGLTPGIASSYRLPVQIQSVDATGWAKTGAHLLQTDVSVQRSFVLNLAIPPHLAGAEISEFHVIVDGNEGGAAKGSLPTSMPDVELFSQAYPIGDADRPAAVSLGYILDASSLATYNQIHQLSITGMSAVIDAALEYYFVFSGETGGGANANDLAVYRAWAIIVPA